LWWTLSLTQILIILLFKWRWFFYDLVRLCIFRSANIWQTWEMTMWSLQKCITLAVIKLILKFCLALLCKYQCYICVKFCIKIPSGCYENGKNLLIIYLPCVIYYVINLLLWKVCVCCMWETYGMKVVLQDDVYRKQQQWQTFFMISILCNITLLEALQFLYYVSSVLTVDVVTYCFSLVTSLREFLCKFLI